MGDASVDDAGLVALGYVSRAHGIHGEVRIEQFNASSEVLLDVRRFVLRLRGATETRSFDVEAAAAAGKSVLARLVGVDTREAAEALRGHEVLVPRSALPEAGDDEVYLFDLVGLDVREDGRSSGRVIGVVSQPAADCARIATARGTIELPLVDPYLVLVDLRDRALVVAHSDDFEPEAA